MRIVKTFIFKYHILNLFIIAALTSLSNFLTPISLLCSLVRNIKYLHDYRNEATLAYHLLVANFHCPVIQIYYYYGIHEILFRCLNFKLMDSWPLDEY